MSGENGSGDREDGPGFASRWSRLKREAKADAPEAEAEAEVAEPEAPAEDDRPDEEVLEELGLPDPDTLERGDNFTAFMAKAVPARLRNRALRRLWISDPVLANLDELLDYGEDFTDAATVVENLQTAYQVGKGFVTKLAGPPEPESESEPESEAGGVEEAGGESVEEPGGESVEEAGEEASEEPAEASDEAGAADLPVEVAPEMVPEDIGEKTVPEERISVRQRMRFRLAEE